MISTELQELEQQEHLLESLIRNEWDPSRQLSYDRLKEQCIELELKGFLPEFCDKFNDFIELLYIFYDNAIKGENVELLLKHSTEEAWKLRRDQRSMIISSSGGFSKSLLALPLEEEYKLENPRYMLARAAKEVVKASPIGLAIAQYRKDHPFPSRYPIILKTDTYAKIANFMGEFSDEEVMAFEGTDMRYNAPILFVLGAIHSPLDIQAGRPILNGSDTGEGDYYVAAFDLLEEFNLCGVLDANRSKPEIAVHTRIELVRSGLHRHQHYTQKFLLAQHRLEKYGADLLHSYLSESPSTLEVNQFFRPFWKSGAAL